MKTTKINWAKYNKELVNRGSITLWFNLENKDDWYSKNEMCRRGRPYTYSWIAIELLCLLRVRFNLTLRGVEGFAKSILNLMGIDLKMPDYSTISRRMGKVELSIVDKIKRNGSIDIAIDSSGLKVYGEGEWKVKMHGRQKHRTWRKIHISVDCKNNKIVNAVLTTNDYKDSEVMPDLLAGKNKIKKIYADGAYDSKKCFSIAEENEAKAVIPPRKNAKISKRNSTNRRDESIREIRARGRKTWKKEEKYHRRSLAETAFSRMKTIMGDKLKSRNFENQASEAFLKCKILNKMNTPKVMT